MSQLSKSRFWDSLLRKNRNVSNNSHIRSARRRMLSIQRLELRELLAVITWDSTKSTGFWDVPSNWIGGVLPGANDDVVIGNQIVTYRTGTTTVKSITAGANFLMTGGTLAGGVISQNSGSFLASGGTLGSGSLTTGTLLVTNIVVSDNFHIAAGATLTIASNATLQVNSQTLQINGNATLQADSRLHLFGSFNHITSVDVTGTLTATAATISATSASPNTRIQVKNAGRLIATDSLFSIATVSLENGAILNSGDWSRNTFISGVSTPANLIRNMSAAGGGADNKQFGDVIIITSSIASGSSLDLLAMGTVSTANLRYIVDGTVTIAAGATMTLRDGLTLQVNANRTLVINGNATLQPNSQLLFVGSHLNFTTVDVSGTLTATSATISSTSAFPYTRLQVKSGGRLIATDSSFSIATLSLESGAILNSGDWSGNTFTSSIWTPAGLIRNMSAAGGGADNKQFGDVNIITSSIASGSSLNLLAMGTVSTANLRYIVDGTVTIAAGATMTLRDGLTLQVNANRTLVINGNATLQPNSQLLFVGSHVNFTTVDVSGTLTATLATISTTTATPYTRLQVKSGGRLIATDSSFSIATLSLESGAILNSGDWSGNTFTSSIWTPAGLIRNMSAAGGGADNKQFGDVNIITSSIASGSSLNLLAMGTVSTANLRYIVDGTVTIAAGATMTLRDGLTLQVNANRTLVINGSAALQPNTRLLFVGSNVNFTTVDVSGTLTATSATISSTTASPYTRLQVMSGGRLVATDSSFSIATLSLESGAILNSGDWSRNAFTSSIWTPAGLIRNMSAAGGGADNKRFGDINIVTSSIASGSSLNLLAMGTESTANLRYIVDGTVTISAGATMTLRDGLTLQVNANRTLVINGNATLLPDTRLLFVGSNVNFTTVDVSGTLTTTSATISSTTASPYTRLQVKSGGRLIATDSSFSIATLSLESGAVLNSGDWSGNTFTSSIWTPAGLIRNMSAAGGGADNKRFGDINIVTSSIASGSSLNLLAMGTESTANLRYIVDGTVTIAAGATMTLRDGLTLQVNANRTLVINGNATLQPDTRLLFVGSNVNFTTVDVTGTLTATSATISSTTASPYTRLQIKNTGVFDATDTSVAVGLLQGDSTSTLRISVVDGKSRTIGGGGVANPIAPNLVQVGYGSIVTVPQTLRIGLTASDPASFSVSYSSIIAIAGHFTGRQTDPTKFRPDGKVIFNGRTAVASPQDIETWSNDLGSSGFGNNLAFGTISVENNSNVRVANTTGASGKALYVNTLNIASGSRFDANNQRIYVRKLINAGTLVNNANVVVVADGGPLLFSTPTPGEITTSQSPAHDEWTFTATQNGPVSIAVNPGSTGTTAASSPQIRRVRIELRSNANTILKSLESTVDNTPLSLISDSLTQGSQYRIRVLSVTGSVVPGNYVITLLNAGASETGLTIGHSGSDSIAKLEGDSGLTSYKFTITRIGDLTMPTSVAWSVSGQGTTPASASDFEFGIFPSGTVNFAANDSSNTREITINVVGDAIFEPNESFVVTLSNPSSGSAILVGTAVSRILNDDAPDKSDLIVSAIVPPAAAQSGQNVIVQWTEKNDGPVPVSGDWSTNLKVTRRSTGVVLVNRNIRFVGNSLPVNAIVNRTNSFDLPDGIPGTGDFDILITVDVLNDIQEENTSGNAETNNTRASSFNASIGNYPEISVTNIQHPSSVQLSVPFDISWTIANTGTAALTKPTTDRVYLSLDGTVDGNDRVLATISSNSKLPVAPNGNYTQTATVTLPLDSSLTPGSYQIIVVADYLNNQFELNEGNNQRTSIINVLLPPLPDLIVESISSKEVTVAGQSVELTWTLKNQGTAPVTGTWGDRIYLSNDAIIGGDLALVTFPITTTIAPNGMIVRKQIVQIPASISGIYRFVVASDIGNTINEFQKEDNNVTIAESIITIDATPSPNLVVESITAQTSGLFSGQPATIEWIVKNVGNASTNTLGWMDAVYLSTDNRFSDDDILLGRTQNPSYLNSDDTYRNTLTAAIPNGTQGVRYFIVFTDSNRQVPETGGEDDNIRVSSATNITLTPPPDLRVTTLTHPRNATEGDSIPINWTILNDGTGGTRQTTWSDQVWLSLNNDVIDAGDILLKTVPRNGALAPQQEYQVLQQTINLPLNAFAARAFIVVRTDANNEVYEDSFEGNNDRASEIQIFQRPIPDLEVQSIVQIPSAVAGQPIKVNYTVVNASVNPTIENTWRDSVYLSTDRILNVQSDLLLGHRTRTGILGGNQSETRTYDFVLPNTLSGNYYLIVFTDSAEQVVELSDTNNTLASTQVTSIRIDPPDLSVTSIGTSTNPMAGRDITISYVVTNRGNSPTPNSSWQDTIYLSEDSILDSSDLRLDERQRIGVLAPNQSEHRTTTVRLPADRFGTARIIVHSDSSDLVYELNNSNNVSSTVIQIGDNRPDLQVASFVLRPNNPSVAPGGTLSFDFEIANRGLGSTFGRSWTDRVILSTDLETGNSDDIVLGSFIRSSDVGAGQSYFRINQSVTIPTSIRESQYWLYLVTDATGVVSELDETNNVSRPIEVVVTTSGGGNDLADLIVSEVTIPASANSGERLPIQWKVQNSGVAITTSSTWFDSVWLSTNSALDDGDIFVGRFARVGALAPGESYIRSIEWPIGIDLAGSYFAIVQTDSTNSVVEGSGEGNNTDVSNNVTTIILSPVADLQVESISIPTTALSGRLLRSEWLVDNIGGATANPSWTDSVYLSLDRIFDRNSDIPIGFVNRNTAVAEGQRYTVTADLQLPIGIGGNYYLVVVTDSTNRVYERDGEDNNIQISTAPITILHLPPADLVVGDIVVPSNAAMGQLATITFSITNAGQNAARGGWYDAVYISSNDQWDIDDEFMGRVWRASDVGAGGSYTATLTSPMPGVIPGNYKVIVRSDIRNNLVEADESNNLKASLDRFALDAPSLTLGTPTQGTFSNGQFLYYKVTVPAGETLLVEFDSSATEGSTELYMSYDAMPRRSRSDLVALKPYQTDQRIILSSTQGGTYYILVHGNEVLTAATPFSILARIVPFSVFDTNFGQGGTAGNRTILIEGAKYDRSVTAELVDSQGRAFPAVNYTRVSDTRLYATFDLTEASIGNYSLRVSKGTTNEQILVPGAFEVVFSLASVQPISLTRPDTFNRRRNDRPPALIPVSLGWRNNTLNDVDVPLIHFSATDPFAASIEDAKAGRTVTSTEFLGFSRTDGPRAVLLPGDFVTAEYFIAPRAASESDPPQDIHYVAEYFYNDAQAPYNWDYDLSQLDMSYLTDDEAIAAIAAFKQAKGSTLGALREVLAEGLNRVQDLSPAHVPATSRLLIQEVFDRFVASRMTSLRGKVEYPNLKVDFSDLAITIKEVGGTRTYSSAVLADGSFVFPKVDPGTYDVTVSGGAVKTNENIRITIAEGQKANLSVTLVNGPDVTRVSLPARIPVGNSPVAAPWITHPGKMSESLSGNVLESVLGDLSGRDYTVELIGDFPRGFSLEPDGSYQFYSNETVAFVVHYDLVLTDLDTRVGRLFGSEIRSRGAIAITLKNNFTRDVRALDPNDIIGPAGYGDEKWVSANEQLAYKIRFENDPRNAMAPALSVNIQQTLSEHLDVRTFEFGSFGFGGREFEVPPGRQSLTMDLDLRDDIGVIVRVFARVDAQSRRVTWTFTTISPLTSDESVNPDEGFLPLNLTPPEGDGFVSYTVRARRTSPTGSKITAEARIIFDGNVPIDTPAIFNTLDTNTPESIVTTTEPNAQEGRVRVKWAGHDGEIGSGLATYDVFVSEDRGRYRSWLTGTNLVEAEYLGKLGQVLSFLTIARDNVGNWETDDKFPDDFRPTAFAGGPYQAIEGKTVTLQGSGSNPDPTKTLIYEWDLDYDGNSFNVESQLQSPTIEVGDGPSVRTVALRVRHSGTNPLVSGISTAQIVIANAPPELSVLHELVRGNAGSSLRNTISAEDVPGDIVSVRANVGTIVQNSDGTWGWSHIPIVGVPSQKISITAIDRDGGESFVSFDISVNSFPTAIELSNSSLAENQPIGSLVGILATLDPDANNQFTYSLVAGDGDAANASFTIVANELRSAIRFTVNADTNYSIRIRSTDQDSAAIDRIFIIRILNVGEINTDFGDAPSAAQSGFASGYPTTLAQDGARHRIGALRLGANIDAEPDGTPSVDALSDDSTGIDDEDGIQFVTPILTSSSLTNRASVVVTASGVGKLDAWIDFNRDGDWNDPGEQIFVSANVMAGRNLLSFTVPTGASVGTSFARFRISTLGSLGPTGLALDGEVEDYRVELKNAHQTGLNLDLMDRDIGQHELLIVDGRLEVRKGATSVFSAPAGSVALVRLFDDQQNIQYRVETPHSTLVGILTYKSTDLPIILTSNVAMMDLSAMSGKLFGMDVIDVTGVGTSVLRVSPGSISSMNASGLLRLDIDKEDRIQPQGLWRYIAGRLEAGEAVHRFTSGGARLDVHSENPWQNPLNRLDVDGDGLVSPLDVLALINAINIGRGSEPLPEYDPGSAAVFHFFDVMGDGDLSPLDVLQVINAINSSQMEGEGESGQESKFAEIEAAPLLTDLVFASDWDDETLFANRRQNNLMSPRRSSRL